MKRWKIVLPTLLATTSLPLVSLVGCGNGPVLKKMTIKLSNGGNLPDYIDVDTQITVEAFDKDGNPIAEAQFSTDSEYVTLSGAKNATIFGNSIGKATITCKAPDFKDTQFDLLVNQPVLRSMTIKQQNHDSLPMGLRVGDSLTIDAFDNVTGKPVNNPVFTSDNDHISIAGNTIKGVSQGIVTIKCEASGYAQTASILTIYVQDFEFEYYDDSQTAVLKRYWGTSNNVIIPYELEYQNKNYTVVAIGDAAFSGCTMTTVAIPNTVLEIGQTAFSFCTSLKKVEFYGQLGLGLQYIWPQAFSGCIALEDITLPDTLTAIGRSAFLQCLALKQIVIPDSVEYIGEMAFSHCLSLEVMLIPPSITYIEARTFFHCTSLHTLELPYSLVGIGEEAVAECSSLGSGSIGHWRGMMYTGLTIGWQTLYTQSLAWVDWHRGTPAQMIRCVDGETIIDF